MTKKPTVVRENIVCPVCQKEFTPTRWNSKYCSDECRKIARHQRAAEKWREDPDTLLRIGVRAVYRARATGDKKAARRAVNALLATGDVKRSKKCGHCGCDVSAETLQAHHADYFDPLNVVWLCHDCHLKVTKADRLAAAEAETLSG